MLNQRLDRLVLCSTKSEVWHRIVRVVGLSTLAESKKVMPMNFFRRFVARFTARGRALAQVDQGMVCANNAESDLAIKHYTNVISSSKSPGDVKAMALFNRALAYATIGKELQAKAELTAVLEMPEATAKISRSASDKLVRIKRKQKREETANSDQ